MKEGMEAPIRDFLLFTKDGNLELQGAVLKMVESDRFGSSLDMASHLLALLRLVCVG